MGSQTKISGPKIDDFRGGVKKFPGQESMISKGQTKIISIIFVLEK